jgi:type IV secretory pathway component VirB8
MRNDWEFDKTESKRFDPVKAEEKFWKLCISAMVISVVAYIGLMVLLAIYL